MPTRYDRQAFYAASLPRRQAYHATFMSTDSFFEMTYEIEMVVAYNDIVMKVVTMPVC